MKKILALVLALMLVFSLCACDKGGGTTNPTSAPTAAPAPGGSEPAPAASGKAYPNCNADGSINLDTIAHYDAEYDYSKNPKYKVAYLVANSGPLYEQSADAYEHWAPLFNMEWAGFISANGDSDMFLTNLQTAIDQGVKAFFLPDEVRVSLQFVF